METLVNRMYREQPDRGPSAVFELYKSTNQYNPETDKSIRLLHRGTVCIIGVVADTDIPKEGDKFVMYYHKRNDKSYFGSLSVNKCVSVTEQEGCYYFEGHLNPQRKIRDKYLLIPGEVN